MNRRSFIKGLIALASAPAIGKYVNVFKTEGAREGIEQVASKGVDFFNMVIKKVMDEGKLINESERIQTFKHPDRPDITVDVDLGSGSSSVYFDTDQGTKAGAELVKDIEVGPGYTELLENEEVYKMGGDEYYKDVQEEITGGITNLEEFLKRKKGFAAGGRVGMFRGGIPKGLQAALRAIMSKYGDDAITTADKAPQPEKTIQEQIRDFNARTKSKVTEYDPEGRAQFEKDVEEAGGMEEFLDANPIREVDYKKQMTNEEIREFADEFGLDPSEEYYNWDGTFADALRLLKESEDETKYMYQQYKAGRLDPKRGEKGREKFLEKKLEEAELSGESKLITRDEIEELEELKRVREMAPQMVERLELRARYPGITDDLLDSILIDDNPQRKAEVLATLDEAFAMMRKGKGPDEVLRIIKDMNRTKQADGGSIDGDVSLTVIKIPDISESGVESLFKRR
jgi:hypothetical protein